MNHTASDFKAEETLTVYAGPGCITVNAKCPGSFRGGTCSISLIPGKFWYVNRVLVDADYRGKGVGSKMLQAAIKAVKEQGGNEIVVEPGGYDADPERQKNFYLRNGFVKKEDYYVYGK